MAETVMPSDVTLNFRAARRVPPEDLRLIQGKHFFYVAWGQMLSTKILWPQSDRGEAGQLIGHGCSDFCFSFCHSKRRCGDTNQ